MGNGEGQEDYQLCVDYRQLSLSPLSFLTSSDKIWGLSSPGDTVQNHRAQDPSGFLAFHFKFHWVNTSILKITTFCSNDLYLDMYRLYVSQG